MNFWKLLFRSWFYFRVGYGTYIAFLIGFASNIIVIYKLGVKENTIIGPFFSSLTLFALLALAVMIPICIGFGLYHMKRTGAYAADATVSTEQNPYIYKVLPGKEQEVFLPLWIMTVRGLARVLEQEKAMSPDERKELQDTLKKADALLKGQLVGSPKQSVGRSA